jgi:hypothetical protein
MTLSRGLKTIVGSKRLLLTTLLPSIVAGYMVGWLLTNYLVAAEPQKILAMHEDMQIASSDGMLNITMTVDKRRVCDGSTDRYLWRWEKLSNGEELPTKDPQQRPEPWAIPHYVLLDSGSIPLIQTGEQTLRFSIALPGVPAGHWFYRAIKHNRCSVVPTIDSTTRSMDVPVTVEAAK